MVRLNDCCLAVNWLKIHDFRDKACQMSQVRPRLLDDIAMLPNGGHSCGIQRAADARLVARGVQRDDAVGDGISRHREVGVEVARRGAQIAGNDHSGQRLEGRVGKPRHAGIVHTAHAHLAAFGQRSVHEGERPLDAAELPDLHHGAAQLGMLEQAGGLFGVHEGFVHADGHGQRMLERRESGERVSQSPLAPGGGQVQWLFDPADIQLVVGAQVGQVVQAEASSSFASSFSSTCG